MKKQKDQMGRMTDGLMSQAAALDTLGFRSEPSENYMVAVQFEGEEQINIVPLVRCEDGCTAALKLAIEHLRKFGHRGIATDALVCGAKFWYRPPSDFIRQMQGERPIIVTNARDGFGRALGRRVLEPIRGQ
ncbi:MAG: hypothetical protein WBP65_03715 [Candidatus Sulfotelmatobacter sp.]